MTNLLRKYQQPALIAFTAIVIIGVIVLWNGNQGGRAAFGGESKRASIYGRAVTQSEVDRVQRKFTLARVLGLSELLGALTGGAQNPGEQVNNFIINSYVFDHEADALQIFPTEAEDQAELMQVPAFQTDGRFDGVKLNDFVANQLGSLGFNASVIDELVRQQVRIKKVIALIGATATTTPAELDNQFSLENERMDVSVVRLSTSDLEKAITIPDKDAQAIYDQHRDAYHSDEQRKVSIASFELTDAQKALKGRDRTEALQKLSNDSWNFDQVVVNSGSDFAAAAQKAGVPVVTSDWFTENVPDPKYSKIPGLAGAAFHVDQKLPVSDVLEGENGYYILHLDGVTPGKPQTFEEAKPKIIAELQKERAAQLMQTRATDVRGKIEAAMKAGKSISEAATSIGLTAETIPPFSISTASKLDVPDNQVILQSAVTLSKGQLSAFLPTQAGGVIVYMNDRQPPDKSTAEVGETILKVEYNRQVQIAAFVEWLRLQKPGARVQIFGNEG